MDEKKEDDGLTEIEELHAQITKLEQEKTSLLSELQAMKTSMIGFVLEANKNAKDYNVGEKLAELQAMKPEDLVKQMPKTVAKNDSQTRSSTEETSELQAAREEIRKLSFSEKLELQRKSRGGTYG